VTDEEALELWKTIEEFDAKIAQLRRKSRKKKREIISVNLPDQREETS